MIILWQKPSESSCDVGLECLSTLGTIEASELRLAVTGMVSTHLCLRELLPYLRNEGLARSVEEYRPMARYA
jgi:hypothetical protein